MKKNYNLLNLCMVLSLVILGNSMTNAQENKALLQEALKKEKTKRNWQESDISEWKVNSQNKDKSTGVTHTYMQQMHNGIPVYNAISVFAVKKDSVVYFKPGLVNNVKEKANAAKASITPKDAFEAAVKHLELSMTGSPELIKSDATTNEYEFNAPELSSTPVKVKLLYLPKNGKLILAWDVSIDLKGGQHWWNVRIDASTGLFLDKNDYVREDNFGDNRVNSAKVKSGKTPMLLIPQPAIVEAPPPGATYNVFPFPVEAPDFGSRSLLTDPADPTASPFGWHDTDGAAGAEYTITRGNNVYAYEDQNNDNLPGYSPDGGANLNFDFPFNPSLAPQTNMDASLTNLFYVVNAIHDKLYTLGFNEADGNFEVNNYGKGGSGNDPVLAEGFDGGGTNNANFATPPDGNSGRMQMYLWSGPDCSTLTITSAGFNGPMTVLKGGFSPDANVTADIILMDDGVAPNSDGCSAAINNITGKIVLIDRGSCTFVSKVLAAQAAGAIGVIIVNNVAGITTMGGSGAITIPAAMISLSDGNILKTELLNGIVTANLITCSQQRDGSFDNGIVAHEFGHGVSNRLTGGPANSSCLGNGEQAGEGWSDWLALMMTIKPGDHGTDARPMGSYVVGSSGIRRYPYSTDMSINPQTYADLALSPEVHDIGEIWCSAVWDLSWLLIDQYGYDSDPANAAAGNNIAIKLVLEGMKLQPCSPGFLDSRDAIFLADKLLYNDAHRCLIGQAFARRGMGSFADQGSADIAGDETADFTDIFCTNCSGIPVAGTTVSNTAEVCSLNSFNLKLEGVSPYQGITYQWQSSPDNNTWTDIAGATEAKYTGTQTAANWYHCLLTCANGNSSSASSAVFIDFLTDCISMSDDPIVTTCSAKYFDSGGPADNYSDQEDHTQTFVPSAGNRIKLTWEYFISEQNYDYITVYNGPGTASPILYGPASGTLNIPPLISTDPSGELTVHFTSDEGVTKTGWKANVSCIPFCTGPVYTGVPNPAICKGSSVELSVTGSSGYTWSPADGLNQTTGSTVIASPATTTTYTVTSADDANCKTDIKVIVFTTPIPTIITSGPTTFCEGGSVTLSFSGTLAETPCTNDVWGQWPPAAFDVPCDDGSVYIVTPEGYAGEYSVINVTAGNVYGFFSTDDSYNFNEDNVTVTDIAGATVYATGKAAAYMMAGFTGQVRFYTNEAGCNANSTLRTRIVACGSGAGLGISWSPGGETTPSITVNPLVTTNYALTLTNLYSGCQGSSGQLITVNPKPAQAGDISGPAEVCRNQPGFVYTVDAIANATSYAWTLPAGMSPVSGGLTTSANSITVKTSQNFNKGSIYVYGINSCGNGASSPAFNVSKNISVPERPSSISGLNGIVYGYCEGGTYTFTTSSNNAETFRWKVSAGIILSGQGTNMVTVQLNNFYSYCVVSVTASNCKATSQTRDLTLKPVLPAPNISGASSVCRNSNPVVNYALSNTSGASSFTWSSPTSTIKFSDGGTPANPLTTASANVSVNFSGVATGTKSVRATANNGCGSSPVSIKYVTVKNCTKSEVTEITTADRENNFTVFPNPTHDMVTVSFTSVSIGKYSVLLLDMTGKVVIREENIAVEGKNEYKCHLEHLSPGLYSLILQQGDTIFRTRIIKE